MNFLRLTLALVPLLATTATQADTDLSAVLPEDSVLVIRMDSFAGLKSKLDGHPLAGLVENETLVEFFAPVAKSFQKDVRPEEFEAEAGMTLDEALALQDGDVVLAIGITELINVTRGGGKPTDADPVVVMAVNIKDVGKFESLLASEAFFGDDSEIARVEETSFMGETMYTAIAVEKEAEEAEGPTKKHYNVSYAIAGKTFVASPTMEALQDAISRIKGDGSGFSSTLAAQRLSSDFGSAEMQLYFNLEPVMDLIEIGIRQGMAPKPGEQPNMMMPTADAVIAALDLKGFRDIIMVGDIEDETFKISFELGADPDRGIAQILKAYGSTTPQPGFVPADVVTVDAAAFDFGTAFEVIEQIVIKASPMLGAIYQGQLQQLQQNTGVDIRTDLIGSIGSGLISYTLENPETGASLNATGDDAIPPMQEFANVIGIKLDDPAAFERALQAVLNMTPVGPMIEQRDYMGTTLRVLPGPQGGEPSGALAINDGWFFFSNKLFAIQGAINGQSGGNSLWKSDLYKDAEDRVAGGGLAVSFARVTPILKLFMQAFAMGYNQKAAQADLEGGEAPEMVDLSLAEELEDLPFYLIGRSYKTEDGIRSEAVIYKNEE